MFGRREEEPVFIGEVYVYARTSCGDYILSPIHRGGTAPYWAKFTADNRDIYKDHDDFVHIFGRCHQRDSVIFYDKVAFGPAREKIERKYNGQKNN